ncbi:phage tail tape measure protein [Mesorhizobium sp. B1-1-7]|uniref:phage tail tape measure protein n=1 Tax=Mesorhizobium sp. B1-1-7 TaxID=2589977 RepID=UPI00112BA908|nr:phage tail tape measure protein [Mesorhizobium sp. B1-1-7]TPN53990.1 phage tail tape measure protein [Mesorhizobium sp. B1-1-7]
MANEIKTRLSFDGVAGIVADLKALGAAGERAFKDIQSAVNKADLAKFSASLGKARSDITSFVRNVALLGAGITAAVGGASVALLDVAKSSGEAADQAGKAAQSAGITTEAYTKLAFAAKMSNVEQGNFDAGMAKLNKTIGAAAQGSKQAVGLFQKLGVSLRDSAGNLRSPDAILLDVADAFSKLPDGALKSALAIQLFGKAGAQLLPFLNEGKRGLIDLGAEAKALGVTLTDAQAKIGDNLGDALDSVSAAARGVKLQLGLLFAPAITQAATALTERIKALRPAIQGFAQDIADKALPVMLDFVNALTGNDAKVQNRWVLEWRDDAIAFGQSMQQAFTIVIGVLNDFRVVLDKVAIGVNAVFGTNVSGDAIGLVLLAGQATGAFRALYSAVIAAKDGIVLLFGLARANPWIAAITAIGGGILLWATRTDQATAALQRHEGQVEGVKNAYLQAGNAVKNMTDEIRNGLILKTRDALGDLVPALEAEMKRLRDLAAAPAKENPFSQALKDFAAGGGLDAYLKAVAAIGAANPKLNDAAVAFLKLAESAKSLQDQIKPSADFLDLLTGKITDAQFQARQAGAGFQALGTDANAGLKNAGAAVDETKGKVEALGKTIEVFRGGGAGITKQTFSVIDGVAHAVDESKKSIDDLGSASQDAGDSIDSGITNSISKIAPAAEEAASGFNSSLGSLDAGAAQQAAEAVVAPFETLPGKFSTILNGVRALLQGGFAGLGGIVTSLAGQVESAIARILSALRQAAAAAAQLRAAAGGDGSLASTAGGSHGGFAEGGLIRGAGGPKSDNILAWLSPGEFVLRAAAVRKLGLDAVAMLNQGVLPSLKGLRGFSLGGVVDNLNRSLVVPRFASGGLASMSLAPAASASSNRTPLLLQFNSGQQIDDITIGNIAMNQLQRELIRHSQTSTGRKPGWR